MEKKTNCIQNEEQKKEKELIAEKAAKAGFVNRLYVNIGQKVGVVELTKLEPRFERNIDKLTSYHNLIYKIVNVIELQVQFMPKAMAKKAVLCAPGENPWEVLGGWLNYLGKNQFDGQHSKMLEKYSSACGRIAQKEIQVQKRTRSHLIKKMRLYTGEESEILNSNVENLNNLLHAIDDSRHHVKSSKTTKEVKAKGETYRKAINAFNETANEVQALIDEVAMVVPLHENEFLKFSREASVYHDTVHNSLSEVIFRLGYHVKKH
ncbi:BAR domain-containing protein [Caenorhabditis elegans]|uniref:BAR domain-containing protein n=1 Tax=Caenorhabditis elegans TaxID=6239 RepID=Q94211_CAEEL|nr:BAR domain-containing protein [Caenorhabditis elegans]CCD67173.1 BAR domain-containing protein [Caenorhabditis elegans]|eukprot:NP_501011.1 Uncharacterized protein CELE_F38A5.6 [Caenorhabditis elegans]